MLEQIVLPSHLTQAQRTPSAAATVQVSHALDLDTSKRSTQKAFSFCDAILETGPAAPH